MKYKQRTLHSFWTLAQAALISVVLASCGGGEGDGGDPAATSTATASVLVEKVCSNCGALDAHTYAGSGIASGKALIPHPRLWRLPSASQAERHDVTLVFTNQTGTAQVMPKIALTTSYDPLVADQLRWDDGTEALNAEYQVQSRRLENAR